MNPDTNDTIGLSRRTLLAGLGAVGVASAGAGLGTTAYFNDTESFEGNTLTAGELDLKLDYRATYAGGPGRIDEINGWYPDFEVEEEEDGVYLIGEVPNIDEGEWPDIVQERDFCAPDVGLINGDQIPVFTLDDVKPGDCGEVTISLHICDNPSWVWMNGELTANDENTVSEPEAGADGEGNALGDDSDGPISGEGELADAIDVTVWYDENCNNILDADAEEAGDSVCVQLVIDTSGSMGGSRIANTKSGAKQLAETILDANPDNQVGVTRFNNGASTPQQLTDDLDDVEAAIDGLSASGGTNAQAGVDAGQAELENCPPRQPRDGRLRRRRHQHRRQRGESRWDRDLRDRRRRRELQRPRGPRQRSGRRARVLRDRRRGHRADLRTGRRDDHSRRGGHLRGSLAGAMAALSDGIALDGNRSVEGRQPYEGGLTQCIGFEWCLPAEVGNEVQTDSVAFDLGFYAEQSRHNDAPDVSFNGTAPTSNSTANVSQ